MFLALIVSQKRKKAWSKEAKNYNVNEQVDKLLQFHIIYYC